MYFVMVGFDCIVINMVYFYVFNLMIVLWLYMCIEFIEFWLDCKVLC